MASEVRLPGPPSAPNAFEVGAESLTLAWESPASTGGAPITAYKVLVQAGGTAGFVDLVSRTGSSEPVAHVRKLTPGAWYEFRVAALTSHGVGAQSPSSQPVRMALKASPPIASRSAARKAAAPASEYEAAKSALLQWEAVFETEKVRVPPASPIYRRQPTAPAALQIAGWANVYADAGERGGYH